MTVHTCFGDLYQLPWMGWLSTRFLNSILVFFLYCCHLNASFHTQKIQVIYKIHLYLTTEQEVTTNQRNSSQLRAFVLIQSTFTVQASMREGLVNPVIAGWKIWLLWRFLVPVFLKKRECRWSQAYLRVSIDEHMENSHMNLKSNLSTPLGESVAGIFVDKLAKLLLTLIYSQQCSRLPQVTSKHHGFASLN